MHQRDVRPTFVANAGGLGRNLGVKFKLVCTNRDCRSYNGRKFTPNQGET